MNNCKCFLILLLLSSLCVSGRTFDILDYGAVADGKTINTEAIQAAIDAAAKAGGGRVIIPAGRFLSGSVFLKNHIELHLATGALLLGSTDFFDYRKNNRWYALILAKDANHISITGPGTIDGQGGILARNIDTLIHDGTIKDPHYTVHRKRPSEGMRPQLIEMLDCRQIRIDGITLKDAACWVQTYSNCRDMTITRIRVDSTAFWNNDGIDLDDCRNVTLSDCFVNSADDGICLKSHDPKRACDRITIRNCTIRSSASAIKFGTASHGNFTRIKISDITVYDTFRSAIALETVDGGTIDDIDISNVTARNTGNAVFLRIGQRNTKVPAGYLRNVRIRNIDVEVPNSVPDADYETAGPPASGAHNLICSSVVGLPDRKIEQVVLENITIRFGGGAKKSVAYVPLDALEQVPQVRGNYPEFTMFGELPATGFFIRHVDGLTLKNFTLIVKEADFRPALVCDDVSDLRLEKISITPAGDEAQVILNHMRDARVKDGNLVKVQGDSTDIRGIKN